MCVHVCANGICQELRDGEGATGEKKKEGKLVWLKDTMCLFEILWGLNSPVGEGRGRAVHMCTCVTYTHYVCLAVVYCGKVDDSANKKVIYGSCGSHVSPQSSPQFSLHFLMISYYVRVHYTHAHTHTNTHIHIDCTSSDLRLTWYN